MKITIRKEELIRLLITYLPDEIVLGEGREEHSVEIAAVKNMPTQDPRAEYSDICGILSDTEWKLFSTIAETGSATVNDLSKHVSTNKDATITRLGNTISNHIQSMRKKIEEWKLPYIIESKKGRAGSGRYLLRKLPF